jgi:hypothetical protein
LELTSKPPNPLILTLTPLSKLHQIITYRTRNRAECGVPSVPYGGLTLLVQSSDGTDGTLRSGRWLLQNYHLCESGIWSVGFGVNVKTPEYVDFDFNSTLHSPNSKLHQTPIFATTCTRHTYRFKWPSLINSPAIWPPILAPHC